MSLSQWLLSVTRILGLVRKPSRHGRGRARPAKWTAGKWLRVETLEDRLAPAAQLQVTPVTWNVVGLDSNNVNVGPNQFVTGVRVTNLSSNEAATNVTSTFAWDSSNANINLVSGESD